MTLVKKEWLVKSISHKEAADFIRDHHYSRGCSHTSVYRHGLFSAGNPDMLMGCVLWLPPTKPAAMSVNKEKWRQVLSLTRMAVHTDAPKNACSFLLSRSIKEIKMDGRFVSLVTYADERMGHNGHVYRASNWKFVGTMKGSPAWIDPATGRQVATQATRTRTKSEMLALGYVNTGVFRKHKFIMHLS